MQNDKILVTQYYLSISQEIIVILIKYLVTNFDLQIYNEYLYMFYIFSKYYG